MGIFSPPAGYSSAKLSAIAALSFALAAAMLQPTFDRDAGIPDILMLKEARGRVDAVRTHKYGVKFWLHGRAETFDYPSKAGGVGIVESGLFSAGDKEVTVLFNPEPRMRLFNSDAYYDVWQLSIDGKSIRTIAESRDGWRSNNDIAAWLFACFLLFGIYFSVSAWRVRRIAYTSPPL